VARLLLLALLWSGTAQAEPLAPQLIPLGQKLKVKGEMYKCYNLGEYKKLLDIDNQLVASLEKIKKLEEIQITLEDQLVGYKESVTLLQVDLNSSVAEVKEMTKKWEAENLARHQAEADKHYWSSLGLIGGSASLLISVLVVLLGG